MTRPRPDRSDRTSAHLWLAGLIVVCWAGLSSGRPLRALDDYEQAPIHYSTATPDNVVSRLQQRLDARELELDFHADDGYVRAVLTALDIPISSQTLVFSKTSLQRNKISPKRPRALYFNDDVYVGFCQQGDVVEISAVDPQLGTVFYTLDQTRAAHPQFTRQNDACLICHGSSMTHQVPGHMIRSVFPDSSGQPLFSSGTYRIDHRSPFEKRWGGWYVTGTHGDQGHLGNRVYAGQVDLQTVDRTTGANKTTLDGLVDLRRYPSTHSDLVALMVLEHQVEAHNLITQANFQTRMALHYQQALNRELNEAADHQWPSTRKRMESSCRDLVRYLLFCDEAALVAPVAGSSEFASEFAGRGPFDDRGRSLRQFDLERRLFRYPCSYLVYSSAMAGLPAPMLEQVTRSLATVLTSPPAEDEFRHLSADDRQAIREILQATWPAYATVDPPAP